jgi:hypothetical protein
MVHKEDIYTGVKSSYNDAYGTLRPTVVCRSKKEFYAD